MATGYTLDELRAMLPAEVFAELQAKTFEHEVKETLSRKCVEGTDVSEFVAFVSMVAETIAETVVLTGGDATAKQMRAKCDRHQIEVPTALGTLNIRLTLPA